MFQECLSVSVLWVFLKILGMVTCWGVVAVGGGGIDLMGCGQTDRWKPTLLVIGELSSETYIGATTLFSISHLFFNNICIT